MGAPELWGPAERADGLVLSALRVVQKVEVTLVMLARLSTLPIPGQQVLRLRS